MGARILNANSLLHGCGPSRNSTAGPIAPPTRSASIVCKAFGCGNGQATLDLAARFDKVIATDASKEQIATATPHLKIEYRVAPAEQSGLANQSVGLVSVAQALHWFDFDHFYAEVRRVLTPNGVIAVWAYGINTVEGDTVNQLMQDFYAKTVGPYWPPERKLVEEGYRTIPFPFTEITPPPSRMEARWTLDQLLGYFSTWSATNRYLKATGRNPLEPLAIDLKRVWGNADSPRLVTWPLSLRVGQKESPQKQSQDHPRSNLA